MKTFKKAEDHFIRGIAARPIFKQTACRHSRYYLLEYIASLMTASFAQSFVPPGPEGEAAARFTAEIDARASRRFTPVGANEKIIWRIWGQGFPLVLLHGGSGGWNHWIRNIEVLARHYQVVIPDLPGLGESGNAPQPVTPSVIAEALASGLDELGLSKNYALAGF